MRVIVAGVFVFAGLLLAVCLLSGVAQHIPPVIFPVVLGVGMAGLFFVLVISALVLFNGPDGRLREGNYVKDLEENGLLVSTEFQATRAFQVEEQEDEGLHYFIELADGTVLYLTGQDLYDYEPIEDDLQFNQPRRFPCAEFTLRTHRDEKFVVDIQCRGLVIEPAYVAPCPEGYWEWEPEDGQVITGETYDEIKQRVASAAARTRPS